MALVLELHVLVQGPLGAVRFITLVDIAVVVPGDLDGRPPHSLPPLFVV